jgi:exopolyphosphatase/guanosine-5'-triphosphate,3'-diphosphate pyrophosphatase
MAELSEVRTEKGATRTFAVEAEDPARVQAAVRSLGLTSRANVCMARGLKTLVGFGTTRFAAIDVGTNSVKLHVGDRHADGTWSTVADRAVVTRLGEGPARGGSLEQEPMRRTIEAIAEIPDESRRAGAVAITAVGTAGLRAVRTARRSSTLPRPAPAYASRPSPARRRAGSPTSQQRPGSGSRAARRLRHRRQQLAVHLRSRKRGR